MASATDNNQNEERRKRVSNQNFTKKPLSINYFN